MQSAAKNFGLFIREADRTILDALETITRYGCKLPYTESRDIIAGLKEAQDALDVPPHEVDNLFTMVAPFAEKLLDSKDPEAVEDLFYMYRAVMVLKANGKLHNAANFMCSDYTRKNADLIDMKRREAKKAKEKAAIQAEIEAAKARLEELSLKSEKLAENGHSGPFELCEG